MISPAFGSGCLLRSGFWSSSGSDSSGREHWPGWEPSVVSAGTRCGSDRSHPLPFISPCTGAHIGFLFTSPHSTRDCGRGQSDLSVRWFRQVLGVDRIARILCRQYRHVLVRISDSCAPPPTAPGPVAGCTLCRFHLDGIAVCRRPTGCPSAETPLESLRHVRHRARSHLVAGARSHHLCLWGRAQLGGESEPLAAIPSPGPR